MSAPALKNLDKVLWPAAGFTKGHMVEYYREVAPAVLPHLAGKPVVVRRFPDGVESLNWFQNELRGRPEWVRTVPIGVRSGAVQQFALVEDVRTLLWAANLASIELHPFLARAEALSRPTVAVFDLDPGPPADLLDCCRVALRLRERLEALGLASFAKVSGSVGLHVYLPLDGDVGFDATRRFARALAAELAGEGVVERFDHSVRAGKVLIDWRQNERGRQMVAPYSLRGTVWPTVSAPVGWEEIERAVGERRAELLVFDARDALERLERLGDLFRPVLGVDTTVVCAGRVYGKADGPEEAAAMLAALGGNTHEVVSGLCLVTPGWDVVEHDVTRVTFRLLTPRDVAAYIGTGEWEGRAGAYAIQGVGGSLVERIEGDYLNVVGLPAAALVRLLSQRFAGVYGFG